MSTANGLAADDSFQGELSELSAWSSAGLLPEMNTTSQSRSLRTALALLNAGRELLRHHSLEDLSIEAVCESAGVTVGAFYGRFETKLAFFTTLQRMHTIRSQQRIQDLLARRREDATMEDLCADIVTLTVENFRSNVGVLRASLLHSRAGMWDLFQAAGDHFRTVFKAQMTPLLRPGGEDRSLRVLFAYQALLGVLVHAVLNEPGPLGLFDVRLIPELVRQMKCYLSCNDRIESS